MLFLLKSAITLALLYSCFFFLLSKETFHRFNRFMLLSIMVASLIAPLLHFTTENPTVINEEFYQMETLIEEDSMPILITSQVVEQAPHITWVQVITWLYLTGVAVMLLLTLIQAISLARLLHGGLRHTDAEGNKVVLLKGDIPPFSIFRFIVMNVKDYEHNRPYILTHEQEHIRLGHTYDLLLLEAMKTFQWFNPFVWFISRDLKAVHEYEADQAVINQGIDAKSYQQLLVTKVVGNRLQPFTNNLNHGSLKKRILMMYQKPKTGWRMLKALCAIPVAALTICAFATPSETDPVEDFVATLETKEVSVLNEPLKEILTAEATPTEVSEMPDDSTPFAIHPVRDQYGRVLGFTHEGKPADGDFECTYEYIFIDGRQATEAEVRNYQSLLPMKWEMLKTANGTAKYDYKDKHGIICITSDGFLGKDDKEPLMVVDGKIVEVDVSKLGKEVHSIEDDDMLKLLNIKSKDDIVSVDVLKGTPATAVFGEKAKNGAIVIRTKAALTETPVDSLVKKLPGAERHEDGSITINGRAVKKITIEGQEVYNNDDDPIFEVCEAPAKYPGGQGALMQFLAQNLRYPKIAAENHIQGRILVQFIIEKDGSCSNFKLVRSADDFNTPEEGITVIAFNDPEAATKAQQQAESRQALNEEALRVCHLMPKWEPAKQQGKVVRMKYTLPITFRLQ